MPTYVYEVVNNDGSAGERFEVVQTMSEPELTKHPESGRPVRRVFLPPMVGGRWGDVAVVDLHLASEGGNRLYPSALDGGARLAHRLRDLAQDLLELTPI